MYDPSLAPRRFPAYVPAWMERIFRRFLERGEYNKKSHCSFQEEQWDENTSPITDYFSSSANAIAPSGVIDFPFVQNFSRVLLSN